MKKLSDRKNVLQNEIKGTAANESSYNQNKKPRFGKEKLSTYGILILIIAVLFIIMQKNEVPLNEITVTDCTYSDDSTSYFIAGTLPEGKKFANSQVEFNEETGIAEITLYQYSTPTFFGSTNFVVMIDTSKSKIKEAWFVCSNDKLQIDTTSFRN